MKRNNLTTGHAARSRGRARVGWSAVLLAGTLATGCETYRPAPLDLAAYDRQWAGQALPDWPGGTSAASDLGDAPGSESETGWGRRQVLAMTLLGHPDLRRARRGLGVTQATAEHARRWADPELGLELLRNLDADADAWLGGVSLGLTLPLSGRRAVAAASADAELRQARAEVRAMEWDRLRAASEAWSAWSAARLAADATADYLGEVTPLVERARRLVEAGEMPPTEARLLRLEVARGELEYARLEATARRARLELLAGMGLRPGTSVSLRPTLEVHPEAAAGGAAPAAGDVDAVQSAMADMGWADWPAVEAAHAGYEVAERELELEIRKQYPDLTIGPVYEREEGQSRVGVGLGLPVPVWNRNAGGIAEARARREVARAAAQSAWQDAAALEAAAVARWRAADELHRLTRERLVDLAEAQMHEARQLLEIGEADVLLLHEALAGVIQTRRAVIETAAERAAAAWDLQVLRGEADRLGADLAGDIAAEDAVSGARGGRPLERDANQRTGAE